MNNILYSISSSADMYIKKRKFNIPIGPYAHKSYLPNTFIRSISEQTNFGFEKISNTLSLLKTFYALTCVNTFFTGRMEPQGRADGFMFYVILETDFFRTCTHQSETTNQATDFRHRSKFRLTIDNFNSIHGIVKYWFNIRRNDPKDVQIERIKQMIPFNPKKCDYWKRFLNSLIITKKTESTKLQFVQLLFTE